jgi:hypothetical protein
LEISKSTLSKIKKYIPKWSKKIQTRDSGLALAKPCVIDGDRLSIVDGAFCIIGEHTLFGKLSRHDCTVCSQLYWDFFEDLGSPMIDGDDIMGLKNDIDEKKFKEHLKLFSDHLARCPIAKQRQKLQKMLVRTK